MKKILVLGAGEMQVPIIRKINELGYCSIAVDYDASASGFHYADEFYVESSTDYEKVLSIAKRRNVDAVLTTSDYPVNIVAKVARQLNLPAMSEDVARICTNKYEQRILLKKNGINCPQFYLVDEVDIKGLKSYPYIVKPVDSSASRGVRKVENEIELSDAIVDAKRYSRTNRVMIEQFIGGSEYSVETLTQNGHTTVVMITEKLIIGEEYGCFVEDTHIEPARINRDDWKLIETEVIKALSAIGFDNCPSHTEVKLFNGKVYIIEIACRLGGDYITSDLVPLSTGIDMLGNLVKISLGEVIDVDKKFSKASCVQFINAENYYQCEGFIRKKDTHIIRSEIKEYRNRKIENSLERLGYIILQADNAEDIEFLLGALS